MITVINILVYVVYVDNILFSLTMSKEYKLFKYFDIYC